MVLDLETVNNANSYSVLNYMPCGIVATSNVTSYKFEPSNGEVPTINIIPLADIIITDKSRYRLVF